MDLDLITPDAVRETLRAIRQAKPLGDSQLLGLGALRARLHAEGLSDSAEGRESELAHYMHEVVWHRLSDLRGTDPTTGRQQLTPERELMLMERDFAAGSLEQEAWSMLYVRYFASARASVREVADRLGASHKTLMRRTTRGYELLAEALREREVIEAPAARHNIPHAMTRFIGRESEIGQLRSLLAKHRMVTVTGVGGIGKSRLAMELGRVVVGDYADGVWMVELGALENEAHVVSTVAEVFGVKERPGRQLGEVVSDFFEAKHLLLILDNCEHLTEACAELADSLLGRCADLQVLATSRERLRVQGECVWTVPGLSVPELEPEPKAALRPSGLVHYDAVRLFTDRAMTALPAFELTADNAGHVAEVCHLLDGIPLATELAASRMKVLAPKELVERLVAPLDLLKDGRRPTRPQHETLRTTLDWSYALLDEKEQVLFRRLSVFRGGWTLDAAEAVCAGGGIEAGEVLDVLQRLVDKSLVDVRGRGGERRYRMLRTVQTYAGEKLGESGETAEARDQHLGHFLAYALTAESQLVGPDQVQWLEKLATAYPNLRTAMDWAAGGGDPVRGLQLGGALQYYWVARGRFGEGRMAISRALATTSALNRPADRAKALLTSGRLAYEEHDCEAAQGCYEASLALARQLGHEPCVVQSTRGLAYIAYWNGDFDAAAEQASKSLELARAVGEPLEVARCLRLLAAITYEQCDGASAMKLCEGALAAYRSCGHVRGVAMMLGNSGVTSAWLNDYEGARTYYAEALPLFRQLRDERLIAWLSQCQGIAASHCQSHHEAESLHLDSLNRYRRLGDKHGIARALSFLGDTAKAKGDFRAARGYYADGLAIARQRGWDEIIVDSLLGLARLLRDYEGDYDGARSIVVEALEISRRHGWPWQTARSAASLGAIALDRGELETAREVLTEAIEIQAELHSHSCIALSLTSFARLASANGRSHRALRLLGGAHALREEVGSEPAPTTQRLVDGICEAARTALSPTAYDAAFAEGRALTRDEAVAYALGEVTWDELADEVAARTSAGEGEAAGSDVVHE